jgi:hypothetical protein
MKKKKQQERMGKRWKVLKKRVRKWLTGEKKGPPKCF